MGLSWFNLGEHVFFHYSEQNSNLEKSLIDFKYIGSTEYITWMINHIFMVVHKEWASKGKLVKTCYTNGTTIYWNLPKLKQNQILLATCNNFRVICYSRNETNSDQNKKKAVQK